MWWCYVNRDFFAPVPTCIHKDAKGTAPTTLSAQLWEIQCSVLVECYHMLPGSSWLWVLLLT